MILHIVGPAQSGKTTIAQALRTAQLARGHGCLLVDEGCDGETQHLLEKIIAGDVLEQQTSADVVNWKPSPLIVFVNGEFDKLDEFEALAPGITDLLGPVYTVTTSTTTE